MENVLIRHTAELDAADLAAVRALCDAAFDDDFGGDFSDDDWEHTLGGVHALRFEGDRLVAHAAWSRGGSCTAVGRCAPATWRPSRWRPTGAAAATAPPSCRRCTPTSSGATRWVRSRRRTTGRRCTPRWAGRDGRARPPRSPRTVSVRTPDADGAIFVRTGTARLDPALPLVCDWRDGDVW